MSTLPISTINTKITEEYLHFQKENQYFERKGIGEKDIKPTRIADELIGMLNADGGVLALGISDAGEIQDLAVELTEEELNKYRSLCFEFIHPSCNIELEEVFINGKLVFLYHVELDFDRLFARKDNEQVFLRMQDSNRKLDREGVKKLEYDKAIRKFEEEFAADFEMKDLDLSLLEEYKEKMHFKEEALYLLYKRHLVRKKEGVFLFRHSAVLLFSQDPEKYIPSASVRYIRYEGKEALSGTNIM